MIIQGTNKPLTLTFSDDMSGITAFSAALFSLAGLNTATELKSWGMSDVTVAENVITMPQTEEESMEYIAGPCLLLVKWLDADGVTEFARKVYDEVILWQDATQITE